MKAHSFRIDSQHPGATDTAVVDAGAIMRVIADVIRRRNKGEVLPDAQVIAAHPQLMPQLADELEGVRLVQRAFAAGVKAAPIKTPLVPIPVAELDAPINVADSANETVDQDLEGARYSIKGYQIFREIGRGGQAVIFKGLQETTGKAVAIKVLPGGPLAGSMNRKRFDQEAEILARLDHPNIVTLIDRGVTNDNTMYLVMPFINGKSLDEFANLCRREGQRGIRRLLSVLIKLARTVGDAHACGIVHRDIKPSNILIDSRDEPHLLDFGLARLLDDEEQSWRRKTITVAGQVVGSLPWSSPEQAQGASSEADPRTDVYSLGLCIQHALEGEHPYSVEGSTSELLDRIRSGIPAKLKPVAGFNTARLQQVVDCCLAKSPQGRFTTASMLATELDAVFFGRLPEVCLSRRSHLRWLIPVIVLAIIGGSVGISHFFKDSTPSVTVYPLPSRQNSVGMMFVRIPNDSFSLGGSMPNQHAEKTVRVEKPFWIGIKEVSRRQFALAFDKPMPPADESDLPVTNVSAIEAEELCRILSKREGRTYRLPTEVEWEYACRAGTSTEWSGTGRPEDMGWNASNSGRQLHLTGQKQANHWGLFDMHGNAAEWCLDLAIVTDLSAHPAIDKEVNGRRIIRGGSFLQPADHSRSFSKEIVRPDAKRVDVGFRVVCEDR